MSTTVSTIAKVATFLRGLNALMVFFLCDVGSSFAMKRFGYEEDAVSIFVAFCSNAMEILHMVGSISTVVIVTILKYGSWTKGIFTQISSGMSMVVACLTVTINLLLLRLYALDDDIDNITRYYWLLVVGLFSAGIDDTCIATLSADDLSPYELGYTTGGIVVIFFHWVVIKILNSYDLDVNYWLIVLQLVFTVGLSTIAAIAWFAFLIRDKIVKTSAYTVSGNVGSDATGSSMMGYLRCMPMVLGSALAWGPLWGAYPIIAPFELVEFRYYYPIQVICLVFHALCGLVLMLIDNVLDYVRHDWYKGRNAWWHLIWLLYIPYLGIGIFFLRCLHYPEYMASRIVLSSPFVVGVLTVVFFFLGSFLFGISIVPIDANSMGHGEVISPMSLGISLVTLNILEYMSEAHIQEFRLAKEGIKAGKAWPTDGMSKHSALRYWIKIAATVGYSNFRDLATADVKQRLGSVARHIVSYRRAASSAV